MKTMNSLIEKELVKRLSLTATLLAFLLLAYSFFFIRSEVERAGATIERQTMSLSEAASTSNDAFTFQKEITRFTETWEATEAFPIRIQVWKEGRLVAASGQVRPFRLAYADFSNTLNLKSGETVEIKSQVSTLNHLYFSLLSVILIELILGLIYFLLIRNMRQAVRTISKPLEDTVSSLKALAAGLPNSAHTVTIKNTATEIAEVDELIHSSRSLQKEIVRQEKILTDVNFDRGRVKMAEEVAHNIKGALTTLKLTFDQMKNVSTENRETILKSIKTIRNVGRNLLASRQQSIDGANVKSIFPLSESELIPIFEDVIKEKTLHYKNEIAKLELITDDNKSIKCKVDPDQFKVIIENLIDNAIEARIGTANVIISLSQLDNLARISVTDKGQGIPKDIIPALLSEGKTSKAGGSGIGLRHARESLEEWGGTLSIESEEGKGCAIHLAIPAAVRSKVDTPALKIHNGTEIVILDDQKFVFDVWRLKLGAIKDKIKITTFDNPDSFEDWIRTRGHDYGKRIYLFDYELGDGKKNGLDLIESYGLATECRLVTGKSNDEEVLRRTKRLGVKQIPKEDIHALKIDFVDALESDFKSTGCLT